MRAKLVDNYIEWDHLDDNIQVDILENIYANSEYLQNNWNIWTFKEYLDDALDLPKLKIEYKSVDKLFKQFKKMNWGISETQLNNLINLLNKGIELDPIMVRGNELFDGGHRLLAYKKLNKQKIPTIDIWPLLNINWKKWMGE